MITITDGVVSIDAEAVNITPDDVLVLNFGHQVATYDEFIQMGEALTALIPGRFLIVGGHVPVLRAESVGAELLDILRDLVGSDTACSFDHHGYCQEHNWFDEIPGRCGIRIARQLLGLDEPLELDVADPPDPPEPRGTADDYWRERT